MTHHVFHVAGVQAKKELVHHLASGSGRRILFMRTKHQARKLARELTESGVPSVDLHGNLSQPARDRNLAAFTAGKARVLVATDIAARGIDIEQLPIVINYDLPSVAEDYVHRIGRTGRAGMEGLAVSLVSHDESGLLYDIDKLLKQPIKIMPVAGYEPSAPLRLDAGAPRPKQGGGGQRQPRGGQRQGKPSGAPRPNGYAVQGRNERPAGNQQRRRPHSRPAAKA
jgi:ATP-dependent RNA helicase RhlE